ncbi:protein Flattop isoform X2 [Xyrichtys novacula]|uniref:Protein Flattop n=1 Tax=Xyrichtys novacula TaxID=13765 RepID=A0AAV1F2H9_XYRNO|nr:protein Flattop isoform X2 [Xyrichtys novacula]
MSKSYSANQFEDAFRSQRLQNWCETKQFKQRPTAQEGHTPFIADDRGHLLPGVFKRGSAWPDFKGTWDLPAHIPPRHINPTGRSVEGINRLKSWGFSPQHTRTPGKPGKPGTLFDSRNAVEQSDEVAQKDGAASSTSAAEVQPAPQDRPISGGGKTQDGQTAVRSSLDSAVGREGPLSPAAEERPAVRSAASQRSGSRAHSDTERPGCDEAQKVVPARSAPSSKQSQRDAQKDQ